MTTRRVAGGPCPRPLSSAPPIPMSVRMSAAEAGRPGIIITRRAALACIAGAAAAALAAPAPAAAPLPGGPPLMRPIPASQETLPVIGLGTWITFNVGDDRALRDERAALLQAFFALGGGIIDSSPMYGSAEAVIGYGLKRLSDTSGLFAATKVWTPFAARGEGQMEESRRLWGLERFDLMQVHNLVNWEGHLPRLFEDKAAGRIRYVGITTSHGRRHDDMAQVMATEPIDFVQFSYNILDREAESRLLPLAADRGLAVIVNRPFRTRELFELFARHPLPDFAGEIDCANWAQFFLKFVVSHPAVTCAIPATSRIDHLRENMGALRGRLPDAAMRQRMVQTVESL
jgi:diketogulonate reductase-like aldo/keto reductase